MTRAGKSVEPKFRMMRSEKDSRINITGEESATELSMEHEDRTVSEDTVTHLRGLNWPTEDVVTTSSIPQPKIIKMSPVRLRNMPWNRDL